MVYNRIADCEVFDAPEKLYAAPSGDYVPTPQIDTRPLTDDLESALQRLIAERAAPLVPPSHDQYVDPYFGDWEFNGLPKNFANVIKILREAPLVDQPLTFEEAKRRFELMDKRLHLHNPELVEEQLTEYIKPLSANHVQQERNNV